MITLKERTKHARHVNIFQLSDYQKEETTDHYLMTLLLQQ